MYLKIKILERETWKIVNLYFFFTEMEEIGVYERDHFSVMKKKCAIFYELFIL